MKIDCKFVLGIKMEPNIDFWIMNSFARVSKLFADSPFMRPNKRKNRMLGSAEDAPYKTYTDDENSKPYVDDENPKGAGNYLSPEMQELRDSPRARMNKHNNDVGRIVVEQSIVPKCKCHGISGACQYRTCWKELPPLIHIGAK